MKAVITRTWPYYLEGVSSGPNVFYRDDPNIHANDRFRRGMAYW